MFSEGNFSPFSLASLPETIFSEDSAPAPAPAQLRPLTARLIEDAEVLLPATVSKSKPSFRQHLSLLDEKLLPLGFERHGDTEADGNCLIHG